MKPQNHPFEKEHHLSSLHVWVPCQFSRVYLLIFRGVATNKTTGPRRPILYSGFSSPQKVRGFSTRWMLGGKRLTGVITRIS